MRHYTKGNFARKLEDKSFFGKLFEKGREDVFMFIDADVAEVDPADGESWPIESVQVSVKKDKGVVKGLTQGFFGSDWHLDTLRVQDVASGAELVFACDDWVTTKAPQSWR